MDSHIKWIASFKICLLTVGIQSTQPILTIHHLSLENEAFQQQLQLPINSLLKVYYQLIYYN